MTPRWLFERIRQQYLALGQEEVLAVYDADDILWMLMWRVAQELKLDWETATAVFSIRDNRRLTPYQQDAIIEAFGNPKMFENIEFLPGTSEIMRPCELGAKVMINSNSFNERIGELKCMQLLAAIPRLRPEDIQMNIISHSEAKKKPLDPRTTIFVDDSPHNVAKSPALINVMPKYMPWSWCPQAILEINGKPTVWRKDLIAINELVYDLTKYLMGGEKCA